MKSGSGRPSRKEEVIDEEVVDQRPVPHHVDERSLLGQPSKTRDVRRIDPDVAKCDAREEVRGEAELPRTSPNGAAASSPRGPIGRADGTMPLAADSSPCSRPARRRIARAHCLPRCPLIDSASRPRRASSSTTRRTSCVTIAMTDEYRIRGVDDDDVRRRPTTATSRPFPNTTEHSRVDRASRGRADAGAVRAPRAPPSSRRRSNRNRRPPRARRGHAP